MKQEPALKDSYIEWYVLGESCITQPMCVCVICIGRGQWAKSSRGISAFAPLAFSRAEWHPGAEWPYSSLQSQHWTPSPPLYYYSLRPTTRQTTLSPSQHSSAVLSKHRPRLLHLCAGSLGLKVSKTIGQALKWCQRWLQMLKKKKRSAVFNKEKRMKKLYYFKNVQYDV